MAGTGSLCGLPGSYRRLCTVCPSGDEGCCTESDLGAHWLFGCSQHPGSRPLRQSPWPDWRAPRWPDPALPSSSRRRWTPVTVRPPFLQQRRSPNRQRGGGKDTARVPCPGHAQVLCQSRSPSLEVSATSSLTQVFPTLVAFPHGRQHGQGRQRGSRAQQVDTPRAQLSSGFAVILPSWCFTQAHCPPWVTTEFQRLQFPSETFYQTGQLGLVWMLCFVLHMCLAPS